MPDARSARPGPADATQPEVLIGGDLLVDKSDDVQLARLCRPFVSWPSSVAGVHHSIAGNGELLTSRRPRLRTEGFPRVIGKAKPKQRVRPRWRSFGRAETEPEQLLTSDRIDGSPQSSRRARGRHREQQVRGHYVEVSIAASGFSLPR